MEFQNVYEDEKRAEAYSKLEFPGTYFLAYRDLPQIIKTHIRGNRALDFGCGTGRSTRFLKNHMFETIGVDIAEDMLTKAKKLDPGGDYLKIEDGNLHQFTNNFFDLILSVFTFDNIPTKEKKVRIFSELRRILKKEGKIINLVSSPDIYINEWASFSTKDFPENRLAKSGDNVKIIMKDVGDIRPVDDILWSHEDYLNVYSAAELKVVEINKPLAKDNEPYDWINENRLPPWVIYILNANKFKG